jgi:hypothetical protein
MATAFLSRQKSKTWGLPSGQAVTDVMVLAAHSGVSWDFEV